MRTRIKTMLLLTMFLSLSEAMAQTASPPNAVRLQPVDTQAVGQGAAPVAQSTAQPLPSGQSANPLPGGPGAPTKAANLQPLSVPATAAPKLESLEELLSYALSHHPDIAVAEAKLIEAQGLLQKARHDLTNKVVLAHQALGLAKLQVQVQEASWKRIEELKRANTISDKEVQEARLKIEESKLNLVRAELELKTLVGLFTQANRYRAALQLDPIQVHGIRFLQTHSSAAVPPRSESENLALALLASNRLIVESGMAERIRVLLDKKVKLDGNTEDVPLKEAIEYFRDASGLDIPLRILLGQKESEMKVSLIKAELPVGAWLQVFADSVPNLRFVAREYGILVTTQDRIPLDAIQVQDFWKKAPKSKTASGDKAPESNEKR